MHNIYVIQNRISGNVYIGQTKSPAARLRNHSYNLSSGKHVNRHLQNSWNLHGESAFDFFFLAEFEDKESCNEAERFYIAWYKALGLAYNDVDGGEGLCNPSAETRSRMRAAKFGKKLAPEHAAKVRQTLRDPSRPHTEESKAKMSASHTGKTLSEDHKAKSVACLQKRVFTEEYRQKLSEASMGNQNFLGRHHSEETLKKMSESRMGAGNPMFGRKRSEEARRKTSETLRARNAARVNF